MVNLNTMLKNLTEEQEKRTGENESIESIEKI